MIYYKKKWVVTYWPSSRQVSFTFDCGQRTMAHIVIIARGEGLPGKGTYTSAEMSGMRGRVFAILLFPDLDPPRQIEP